MDQVTRIPELVDILSSHMDLDTLAACVRVCKAWHEIYIPHLWHTFGTFPHQPVRFGEPDLLEIKLPGNIKFPLYVSENNGSDDPSATKTRVFSMARPEIYRGSFHERDRSQHATHTVWDRFFGGLPPRPDDEETDADDEETDADDEETDADDEETDADDEETDADEEETVATIVAKHAKHIRCLVISSQWIFDVCEHVCRELTSLYFDLSDRSDLDDTTDYDLFAFVQRQSNLHSIHAIQFSSRLKNGLLSLNRDWLHFDVMLNDEDFSNIHLLLPHTRTVVVELPEDGFDIALFRLSRPHVHLKELKLRTDHFSHVMLKDILESFPNLVRLIVETELGFLTCGWARLELFLDNGYSMLIAQESLAWNIGRLVPLLSNLLVFQETACIAPVFDILAQHCPRLIHCHLEGIPFKYVPFVPILHSIGEHDSQALFAPPEYSISRVLASCRDLESVYCIPWTINLEDMIWMPWVCHKLKTLHCIFGNVPLLSRDEQEIYRSLLERRRDWIAADQQDSQPDSEWMNEDEKRIDGIAKSLKVCIEAIEEQLQRLPEVDLNPSRIGAKTPAIDSFLGQMEAAKASIRL